MVNVQGNIRIRITKATGEVNSTSVNIDDISITDYSGTGTNVDLKDPTSLHVYALNGNLYVNNLPEQAEINIYDLAGKLLKRSNEPVISLENSGMYLIKIISQGNTRTFKVLNK
ncbi:MAG: T9SS type A sorting domain-containing protein [Candidatus Azobacteroides sp.]|nr:T9SS type A sorting domain-containing protein [Candidatus Azobacteroides sp.]